MGEEVIHLNNRDPYVTLHHGYTTPILFCQLVARQTVSWEEERCDWSAWVVGLLLPRGCQD